MSQFEEDKARLLQQIELGGGFTSPSTERARKYLDSLIAAQVQVEQPDSVRAQVDWERRDHTDLRDASEKLLRAIEEPRAAIKQVIVYRRDLKMRKGKIAAQVAHASMKVFFDRGSVQTAPGDEVGEGIPDEHWLEVTLTDEMAEWVQGLFTKIVLTVKSEEDLLRAKTLAEEAGIPTALITDAGRTEFHGVPTHTAVAIGPARSDERHREWRQS